MLLVVYYCILLVHGSACKQSNSETDTVPNVRCKQSNLKVETDSPGAVDSFQGYM